MLQLFLDGKLWFLDFFRDISAAPYHLIFSLVKSFMMNAPSFVGGYEGIDYLDVCSHITGVSSTLLIKNTDICDERVDTYLHGRTTIVVTAIVVFLFCHSFSLVKFIVNTYYHWKKDEQSKRRYQQAAEKGKATARKNQWNDQLVTTIKLIVFSKEITDDTTKVKLMMEALGNNESLITT